MIRIQQLKIPIDCSANIDNDIADKIAKTLRIPKSDVKRCSIVRRSIDARKKDNVQYIFIVDAEVKNEKHVLKKCSSKDIFAAPVEKYIMPLKGQAELKNRPVIVGAGPAGLFSAYLLAKAGYSPLVIERGECVEKRSRIVEDFWNGGKLDINTNVQFGEGGAGTFSDGKLNTMVKDPHNRIRKVLETFVEFGASGDILYINKPHIGTDVLKTVVINMRKAIIDMGGEFRFNTTVTDFIIENNSIKGVKLNNGEQIDSEAVILAIGHSARDTFKRLKELNVDMKQKAFAVGVRVEHPQELINKSQYGEKFMNKLPAADYKLTAQSTNGRGVYSFCMCPGGYVVNASSEEGLLAVNGMSYNARAGQNANSAIIVAVRPEDFGSSDVLAGVEYQRKLERAAYNAGKGSIPVQLFGDFKNNILTKDIGDVVPQSKGSINFANLNEVLPEYICDSLKEGIESFGQKIEGYARYDAVLLGVESRTSSPVRINRDENFESNIKGLFPCGEGAGYAGGITSAAVDGLKNAEEIIRRYKPN